MALGDNNSGKKDQKFEDTFYSRIKFSNKEEKLNLGFSFWKGLLKISISSEKAEYNGVKYEELIAIHLSPLKAMTFAKNLQLFLLPENFNSSLSSYGINTGLGETQSVISIGNEEVDGVLRKVLRIAKVDPTGSLSNDISFTFNTDYHYYIEWSDFTNMVCDKKYLDGVEIELMLLLLNEFVSSITGAVGYAVADMARFNNNRVNGNINAIMDALNIERKSSKSGGDYTSSDNSFFNTGAASKDNTNRGRSNRTSIDDIGK